MSGPKPGTRGALPEHGPVTKALKRRLAGLHMMEQQANATDAAIEKAARDRTPQAEDELRRASAVPDADGGNRYQRALAEIGHLRRVVGRGRRVVDGAGQ